MPVFLRTRVTLVVRLIRSTQLAQYPDSCMLPLFDIFHFLSQYLIPILSFAMLHSFVICGSTYCQDLQSAILLRLYIFLTGNTITSTHPQQPSLHLQHNPVFYISDPSQLSYQTRTRATMRWPWSSDKSHPNPDNDQQQQEHYFPTLWSSSSSPSPSKPRDWNTSLNATDWAAFTETRTLVPTLILTGSILALVRIHRRYFRRFSDATKISPWFFRRRSIYGQVTSVGDGDNFRLYHTPGGKLTGWGWLPWKKVPTLKRELRDKTVRFLPFSLFFFLFWYPVPYFAEYWFGSWLLTGVGARPSSRH